MQAPNPPASNPGSLRQISRAMKCAGFGPVTIILIIFCVAIFVVEYSKPTSFFETISISKMDISNALQVSLWRGFLERLSSASQLLPEIRHGQIWRLITPIFLHLTFLHLLFNLVCLRDLGTVIEVRQSSVRFLLLVSIIAVITNVSVYLIAGLHSVGMSAVVYALAGYIWTRGKFSLNSGYYINPITLGVLLIWFFVCLVGIIGPAPVIAHIVGLMLGLAWGFGTGLTDKRKVKGHTA